MANNEGFLKGLLSDIFATEVSRDSSGRVDPYAAAGISYGLGNTDMGRLGTSIGIQGGFGDVFGSGDSSGSRRCSGNVYANPLLQDNLPPYALDNGPYCSDEVISFGKNLRDRYEELWLSHLKFGVSPHSSMALIWDDAVRITYNVNPLTAAILICGFAQYKLRKCLQTDSLMWHFAVRELEKLCQEKNIDWQIVKKVEMSLGFMREEIEKDPEDQHGIDYEVFFDSASRVLPSDCSPMDKALMMYILIDAFVPAHDRWDARVRLYRICEYLLKNGLSMDEFVTAHHDVRKKEREKTADRSCLSTLIGSADTMTPNYDAIWDLIGQIDRISAALADLHEDDPDTSLRLHRAIELLTEAGNILGAGERARERAGRV